jgi:hypothetical protein
MIGRQAAGRWPEKGRWFFCLDRDLVEACTVAADLGYSVQVRRVQLGLPAWELTPRFAPSTSVREP